MTKQEIKRENIILAAIEVFSKDGFHNSKITKIAELAGIATGSVYLYFENKEHILEEIFLRVWSVIADKFRELIAATDITCTQKILSLVLFIAERTHENRSIAPIILQEYQFWNNCCSNELKEKIEISSVAISKVIEEGIRQGEFRSSLEPKVVTPFLIGGIWFIMEYWTNNFDTIPYSSIELQLTELAKKCLK